MGDKTDIEWTDATWNPIRGCSRVSQGCRMCYAERVAHRFSGPGQPYEGLVNDKGRWNGTVRVVPHVLDQPLRWTKKRRVFVNSMSDLFHENLSFDAIAGIFGIMAAAPKHTFQVLTKRPGRAVEFFEWIEGISPCRVREHIYSAKKLLGVQGQGKHPRRAMFNDAWERAQWPLPNVWLGVSVEDQKTANERIPLLAKCPAAVRWVSFEPALAAVDFEAVERVDWIVMGGESGPGARPMHPDWATKTRDACERQGVPFLFKQHGAFRPVVKGVELGTHAVSFDGKVRGAKEPMETEDVLMVRVGKKKAGRLLEGRTWDEYPEVKDG